MALAFSTTGAAGSALGAEQQRVAAAHSLRDTIHTLPAAEAAAAFAALERRAVPPPRQDKIDHFVVLYMENQAFLRTLGCQDLPGLDGVGCARPRPAPPPLFPCPSTSHHWPPVTPPSPAATSQALTRCFLLQVHKDGMQIRRDPKNKSAGMVNITCGTGQYVCKKGGGFSYLKGKSAGAFFEPGADGSTYPYPKQSIDNAGANGAHGNAVEMFSMEQLPIKTALAHTYGF
jgi:hypothetical protein